MAGEEEGPVVIIEEVASEEKRMRCIAYMYAIMMLGVISTYEARELHANKRGMKQDRKELTEHDNELVHVLVAEV